jgi:hypothetical protein
MTDDEIRALVREAIARNLGHRSPGPGQHAPFESAQGSPEQRRGAAPPAWRAHASFGRFLVTSGTEEDGACLIEPNVRCNHCGYCQSYGH